ncbi:MAG: hypothetical protein M2R46_02238 [Verrucomicrobia subdivision 3 bacterium]|nr:hypothetical protein [Limisphaerales bacterium]
MAGEIAVCLEDTSCPLGPGISLEEARGSMAR